MNAPQVVALIYTVKHGNLVDYLNASPLSYETPEFHLTVADKNARFELKKQFTDVKEARKVVNPFIRQWEFEVTLKRGPGHFSLRYKEPKIRGEANHQLSSIIASARVVQSLNQYPSPPSESTVSLDDPDVKSMYARYVNYRSGGELLPGMAYFCLTVLEYGFKAQGDKDAVARKRVAEKYQISTKVLKSIGKLSARGGRSVARKLTKEGVIPLTKKEGKFLKNAVAKIIFRAAEVAADDSQCRPQITRKDCHSSQ